MVLIRIFSILTLFAFFNHCSGSAGNGNDSSSGVAQESPIYKGLWAPSIMNEGTQSMDDPDTLINDGFNTVSIVASVIMDGSGNFVLDTSQSDLGNKIDDYQARGFQIFLVPDVQYSESGDISEVSHDTMPEEVLGMGNAFQSYTGMIETLVALAVEKNVDIFSPFNEPDLKLGESIASSWGQEILATIRSQYSGKLMWKASNMTGADYSGYDILGISLNPFLNESSQTYTSRVSERLSTLQASASVAGVAEIVISEFGVWGDTADSLSESDIATAYETVLETCAGQVNGFFAFDGPEGFDPPLKDSPAEDIVADWFLNQLP